MFVVGGIHTASMAEEPTEITPPPANTTAPLATTMDMSFCPCRGAAQAFLNTNPKFACDRLAPVATMPEIDTAAGIPVLAAL